MTERPVVLQIPASSAYVALARAATMAVCARLGYPVDRLDDMAIAVSEATSLVLQDAMAGTRVTIALTPWRSRGLIGLDADLSFTSTSRRPPRPTSMTWTVLASLVNNVSSEIVDDTVTLHLRSRQEAVRS